MERKDYRDFISRVLYNMNFRRMMNTDLYETKDYLFTEYSILFSKGNSRIYYLFNTFSVDGEMKFYLYLDMLTYLPFEKLGVDYLNEKLAKEDSNVIEYKYNKMLEKLNEVNFFIDDEEKNNIKYFLNNYYNDVVEMNIIGFTIFLLRMFHRYVTLMNFGAPLASMKIHNIMGEVLDKFVDEVTENKLNEININDYLPEFDFNENKLNDKMIEYIELCLKRQA